MILYVWSYSNGVYTKSAIIDYATSIIWVKRFTAAGEFELYLPASAALMELFSGNTLITRDDTNTVMIPEKVVLTTDAETGDYLTISGRSAESIIGRRIVPKQSNYKGTTENVLRQMLTDNIISPADSTRQISIFTLGTAKGYTETIDKQVTGKNLLTVISDICTAYEYGFELLFTGGNFVFDIYKGVDRSAGQTENPRVVFSPEFENLGNTEYSRDTTTYYNSVYVAGQGEGKDRVIINTNSGKTGLFLREEWVDARQTSSNTDEGELTPEQYAALLTQQGAEELGNAKETTNFGGEILDANIYIYGVDYGLGDKVSVINEYGITGTATVTEITEVEDETGYKIYPTLSEWSV